MTRKQKRLMILGGFGLVLVSALALILTGLRDQIVFFRSPSEVMAGKVKAGEAFRLGGLVEKSSVLREPNQMVRFRVTDGSNAIAVTYRGLLPDLFREGQGVVTEGRLDASGAFTASTVLARHDENYMPREVADALKQQGHWQPGKGDGPPKP
ncbi:MAG: cytochrome c maturation protein CcmE [Methylobacterium sp.]|nr:cytochrome c maturation protein CcmE [Methylobacterium sp.]